MSLKQEFKKQMRLAITAAIGFLIAFAWKDYIFALIGKLFSNFSSTMPTTSKLLIALTLTFIGVILIYINSKMLK